MIRWKVVRKEDRKSAVVYNMVVAKQYTKGNIVSGEGLGVFCFKLKRDAEVWIENPPSNFRDSVKIIKVRGIGRGVVPKKIKRIFVGEEDYWYDEPDNYPPKGTICYRKVEVLS